MASGETALSGLDFSEAFSLQELMQVESGIESVLVVDYNDSYALVALCHGYGCDNHLLIIPLPPPVFRIRDGSAFDHIGNSSKSLLAISIKDVYL